MIRQRARCMHRILVNVLIENYWPWMRRTLKRRGDIGKRGRGLRYLENLSLVTNLSFGPLKCYINFLFAHSEKTLVFNVLGYDEIGVLLVGCVAFRKEHVETMTHASKLVCLGSFERDRELVWCWGRNGSILCLMVPLEQWRLKTKNITQTPSSKCCHELVPLRIHNQLIPIGIFYVILLQSTSFFVITW